MKAFRKEFYMEIRKSLSRYISIFMIVALGVAFYAGVRSSEPDMRMSADKMYDESSLLDIRLLSTIGVSKENVDAIAKMSQVEAAEGVYHKDFISYSDDKSNVVTVMSINDSVNKVTLVDGKMPSLDNECLVDAFYMESKELKIGDVVKIETDDDSQALDSLKYDEYIISGSMNYSNYLGIDRGTSTIGNGKVEGLIAINKNCFTFDTYTEIYTLLKDTKKLQSYEDEYSDKVSQNMDEVKLVFEESVKVDYNKLVDSYIDNISASMGMDVTAVYPDKEKEDIIKEVTGESVPELETYVLDRQSIQSFVEYDQDATRIGNIGKVFPMVFFLVAAFVSLTTMTRMVEEERVLIGTYKALGYSKLAVALKYILYALSATLFGGLIGGYIGSKILPSIIIGAYKILYHLTDIVTPINSWYYFSAVLIAVACVVTATVVSIFSTLMSTPATLMRPAPPKNGRRVLLERVGFIWKHLNFSKKSTVRNLVRYKKRLFMTLFGIAGCMALLLVGFGLKDSINSVVNIQYSELRTYDMVLTSQDSSKIQYPNGVLDTLKVYETAVDFSNGEDNITGYINVLPKDDNIFDYLVFRDRNSKEQYTLSEDGVILSEKTATMLNLKEGDSLTVKVSDTQSYEVKIFHICENYIYHNVFMTDEYYSNISDNLTYNEVFVKLTEEGKAKEEEITTGLLNEEAVTAVTYIDNMRNKFDDMLGSLDIVTVVLVVSAAGLAFIVLFNLNNINVNERVRELATLKVLGFYDGEVSKYVYRENVIITGIGIILGIGVGKLLHKFVIETAEIDMVMFGRNINGISYVYAIALTILFAIIVNVAMHFKLKKINMATSLKSVE